MQFLTSLLGGPGNALLSSLLALAIVVLLILVGLWLFRLILGVPGAGVRPRRSGRRLGIVEQLPLDARHRLIIVRRDGVEHVLVSGGADIVVLETGLPAEKAPFPRRFDEAIARSAAPRDHQAAAQEPPTVRPQPEARTSALPLDPAPPLIVPPSVPPESQGNEPVYAALRAGFEEPSLAPTPALPPDTRARGPLRADIEHLERAAGQASHRVRSLRQAFSRAPHDALSKSVAMPSSSIRINTDSHTHDAVENKTVGSGFAADVKSG